MKLIITPTILLIFVTTSFSQDISTKQDLKEIDYYKKSSDQKTAAWLFSGTGTAGLLVTFVADAGQTVGGVYTSIYTLGEVEPEYKSYTGAYLFSAACLVTGIYFFVASSTNKHKAKAASVFIDMENAPLLKGTMVNNQSFPVVGVKIRL